MELILINASLFSLLCSVATEHTCNYLHTLNSASKFNELLVVNSGSCVHVRMYGPSLSVCIT